MSNGVEADLSLLGRLSPGSTTEWRTVCVAHHNMLLEGPDPVMESALTLLMRYLREPVVWMYPAALFELPTADVGTLILPAVGDLSAEKQTLLFAWLNAAEQRTQIVSTTSHALFPLVVRGLFNRPLYYRLNVTLLRLELMNDLELDAQNADVDRTSDRRSTAVSTSELG